MKPPATAPTARRQREREEMRQLIIDAARRLFVEQGYAQVTVRKIAEAIEYTPGAIYSYFEDKDAILHALHTQGFAELMRCMADASLTEQARGGTPVDQIRALGLAYLRFAHDHPEMYDLMFVAQAPVRSEPEEWPEGRRAFGVLRGVVREAVESGWIRAGEPEAIAFALWSACHGMVTLEFRGRCRVIDELHRPTILARAFDVVLDLIAASAGGPAGAPPEPERPRAPRRRSPPES
jgi:AcrR family transcriptional regulator